MIEITEQEVMHRAATKGLDLWNQLHTLFQAVNECDLSKEPSRTYTLTNRVNDVSVKMSELLNESAREVFTEKLKQAVEQDNRASINLNKIPVFGGSHANARN